MSELTVANPTEMMRQATDVAGVSKSIVVKTAMTIQGRKYVKVEGWQAIATAHGCILSAEDVKRTETGYSAVGYVMRISDGARIAKAEGFVGDDERVWFNRAEYAKRAMAQTRAMSRAARSAFAHVVVMMDAGLETTPAEEIPTEPEEKPLNYAKSPETTILPVVAPKPAFSPEQHYKELTDKLDRLRVSTKANYEGKIKNLNKWSNDLFAVKDLYESGEKMDLYLDAIQKIHDDLEVLKAIATKQEALEGDQF